MFKKTLACLLALLLLTGSCLAELTVISDEPVPTALDALGVTDLTITWVETPIAYRCIITWQADGNDYEAAIMGLGEQLTDEQVLALLGAWRTRTHASVTGSVIDAEKQTNKLSYKTGSWLVNNTEDRPDFWGDAQMCWAGAASNMLWSSGWAMQAINPLTGVAFASEDEVFTLFINNFINDGGWSAHGIRWFFTGSNMYLDIAERFPARERTCIEGYDPQDYQHGSMNEFNPTNTYPVTMAEFVSLIRRLKDGAAVGTSVGFNEERYYLDQFPGTTICWNVQKGCYMRDEGVYVKKDDCIYGPYHFSDMGDPLPLTEQDGLYLDENGQTVDPTSVLLGYLCEINGQWWLPDILDNDDDQVFMLVEYEVPAELIEQAAMVQYPYASHMHALTITGYVMNLSAADAGDMVEALFIANSDNDAAIWQITPDTLPRELRPNTYDLYPVSVHECDEGAELRTLCLEQFMEHNLTLINNIVTLDAFPQQ